MSTDYARDITRLEPMVQELREQRNRNCEPKSNENRRYLEYSVAVSSINWIIKDLQAEDQ
jgi:hypothetical protein